MERLEMMTLYNLTNEMRKLYYDLSSCVDENGEIVNDDIVTKIGDITECFEKKAEGYGVIVRMMDSDIDMIDFEIKRLKQIKERKEKNRNCFVERIACAMSEFGYEKIERPGAILQFRKSKRTICDNVDLLPPEYVVVKQEKKPDFGKIKEALSNGIAIEGCRIEEHRELKVK